MNTLFIWVFFLIQENANYVLGLRLYIFFPVSRNEL